MTKKLLCVKCQRPAITAAAHIPVCTVHDEEYAAEARKYLPLVLRPVYQELIRSYEEQTGKPYFIR